MIRNGKGGVGSLRRQITGYIPCEDHAEFHAYARSLGLDGSKLLVLLLLRASRVGPSERTIQEAIERAAGGPAKITAHFVTEDVYARAASVVENGPYHSGASRVFSALIRLELDERWLGAELGVDSG